jgi:hypothetical protein
VTTESIEGLRARVRERWPALEAILSDNTIRDMVAVLRAEGYPI